MFKAPIQRDKFQQVLSITFVSLSMVFSMPLSAQEENEEVMLELQQVRPLQFPKITINEASRLGSVCVANGAINPIGSLCPNAQGQAALFSVSGSSYKVVSLFQNTGPVSSQGFQFSTQSAPMTTTLDSKGTRDFPLGGSLKLMNKNAVSDGRLQFQFDISVAYQ